MSFSPVELSAPTCTAVFVVRECTEARKASTSSRHVLADSPTALTTSFSYSTLCRFLQERECTQHLSTPHGTSQPPLTSDTVHLRSRAHSKKSAHCSNSQAMCKPIPSEQLTQNVGSTGTSVNVSNTHTQPTSSLSRKRREQGTEQPPRP